MSTQTVARARPRVGLIRHTLGPLLLIAACPPAAVLVWYTHTELGGSVASLVTLFEVHGGSEAARRVFGPVLFGTTTGWTIIGVFAAVQLALMRLVPGRPFRGPVTPNGNVPVYKANGPACFVSTLALFALTSGPLGLYSPAIVYDHFGGVLGALNVFSLGFCLLLLLKGRYRPSSSDASRSGSLLFDYYWGTELYPRILGWDVKQFTNCRFGMMGWAVILLSFAAAQAQRHGLTDAMLVAVGIQLVYIAKFFLWETGYLSSLDIMHDRAGFYICWGCLVWVPAVYTSSTLYLVNQPHTLGLPLALTIFVLGVGCVLINFQADRQRQRVRASNGDCRVWGRPPALLEAAWVTRAGEPRKSLLLTSGWWGVARHFHYVPELLGAFFWTLPVLFGHALPWFYVVFLAILLTDRAVRDERRCREKYGADWDRYCERVPWRILPGVY